MNEHESPLKIGALAQASGISARMLRFYEKIGLLMPVRNAAGYRLYQAADVDLVRKVRLLNQAGVPLKDLALMRDCLRDAPQDFCPDLRRRLLAQQVAIARQIIELQQSGDLLTALLEK
jgi:merR family transcription regulator